jgi:hypothetical protein
MYKVQAIKTTEIIPDAKTTTNAVSQGRYLCRKCENRMFVLASPDDNQASINQVFRSGLRMRKDSPAVHIETTHRHQRFRGT